MSEMAEVTYYANASETEVVSHEYVNSESYYSVITKGKTTAQEEVYENEDGNQEILRKPSMTLSERSDHSSTGHREREMRDGDDVSRDGSDAARDVGASLRDVGASVRDGDDVSRDGSDVQGDRYDVVGGDDVGGQNIYDDVEQNVYDDLEEIVEKHREVRDAEIISDRRRDSEAGEDAADEDQIYETVRNDSESEKEDEDVTRGHHEVKVSLHHTEKELEENVLRDLELREKMKEQRQKREQERRRDSSGQETDEEDGSGWRRTSAAEDNHADSRHVPTTPTSSGKFVLRTLRTADPLHVLRNIRHSTEGNPETDELSTILRDTADQKEEDTKREEQAAKQERLKSFITSKLVHKFEQGFVYDEQYEPDAESQSAFKELVSEPHHTTVGKTTVVRVTVKAPAATSPLSPKSPTSPKSPQGVGELGVGGGKVQGQASHSSQTQKPLLSSQTSNANKASSSAQLTNNSSRQATNDPPKTPGEASVPAWKTEIEVRKKTKSYVQSQKLKEPLKMSEVPEWKRQLQEKNKIKKLNTNDESELTLSKILLNPSAASLPFKMEMERLKKEMLLKGLAGGEDIPEWARLADEKKKQVNTTDVNGNDH